MNRFFICKTCGNLVGLIHDGGVPLECCGEVMQELTPNTVDASYDKHVPVTATCCGNQVKVNIGSVAHPMVPEHYIEWVYLETERGGQRKALHPGEEPVVEFCLMDDKPIAAYAYCNIHGLWKADV